MRNLTSRLQARLESRPFDKADVPQMTDTAVALWSDIAAVLSPVIGMLGMAALFRRALSISLIDVPGFASVLEDTSTAPEFAGLRKGLSAARSSEDVAKDNQVLLRNFIELLATLIGVGLAERLLNQVPEIASSGSPPQEIAK